MYRLQVARGTPTLTDHHARALPLARMLLITAVIIAVDQATKAWAASYLANHTVHVVGPVYFELARNPGGAFSTFTRATPVLAVIAVGLTVMLVRLARKTADRVTAVALAIVLGGALGNLVDRVARAPGFLRGHVVDFIRAVTWWPTFNVADAAITIGAVLLVIRGWRSDADPDPNEVATNHA